MGSKINAVVLVWVLERSSEFAEEKGRTGSGELARNLLHA